MDGFTSELEESVSIAPEERVGRDTSRKRERERERKINRNNRARPACLLFSASEGSYVCGCVCVCGERDDIFRTDGVIF